MESARLPQTEWGGLSDVSAPGGVMLADQVGIGSAVVIVVQAVVIVLLAHHAWSRRRAAAATGASGAPSVSEQEYRELFDASGDAIFVHDAVTGAVLDVNQTMLDMFGCTREEALRLVPNDSSEGVPPYSHAEAMTRLQAAMHVGPQVFEWRARRKSGELFWAEVSLRSCRIGGQRRVLASVRDITERKRVEEALRESSQFNEQIIQSVQEGIIVYDRELRHRVWNPFMEQLSGIPAKDILGRAVTEVSPSVRDVGPLERFERLQGALRGETYPPKDFPYHVPHSSRSGWTSDTNAPLRNAKGEIIGVIGTVREVSERKQAEETLRRTNQTLEALIAASPLAIVALDADFNVTMWSPAAERIFGWTEQEVLGHPYPLVPHGRWREVQAASERLLQRDPTISVEERVRQRKDGNPVDVSISTAPLRDAGGRVVGVMAILADVTTRKRAEMELVRVRNYLSNIVNSMPSILVGVDLEGIITQWNRQAEVATGLSADEAVGQPIRSVLADFAPWIEALRDEIVHRRPASMERLLLVKEGERRFYNLMLYPLATDHIEGAVVRIDDVTERTRIQELMIQTEKMISLGGLAAGMAHEINNPLGIIAQAAQNIERRVLSDLAANQKVAEELGLRLDVLQAYLERREIPAFIRDIREASNRAAGIISNMLQFGRKSDAARQRVVLAEIVDRAVDLAASDYDLKKRYDFRSIELIREYEPGLPPVSVVAVEMEQVFLNLLKNAAHAMAVNPPERKPRITLRLRRDSNYAVAEVEDNGPGMPESVLRRVFEPFFTTKAPGVGTGLGLSVSYIIVTQNHHGLIHVDSSPGHGSRFTVQLPFTQET